jgi:hypothetical protein
LVGRGRATNRDASERLTTCDWWITGGDFLKQYLLYPHLALPRDTCRFGRTCRPCLPAYPAAEAPKRQLESESGKGPPVWASPCRPFGSGDVSILCQRGSPSPRPPPEIGRRGHGCRGSPLPSSPLIKGAVSAWSVAEPRLPKTSWSSTTCLD